MKLVYDIEANGLLRGNKKSSPVDRVWMIIAKDLDTGEEHVFCDETSEPDAKPLNDFRKLFDNAKEIIAHNQIQYDLPVLKKLMNWQPKPHTVIRDTLLMSQVLDYNRFNGKHNLAVWGEYLGVKKPEHEDWLNFSEDMVHRCREDVRINEKVYRLLARELTETLKSCKHPEFLKKSLRIEHKLSEFQAQCAEQGWVFDMKTADRLEWAMESELAQIRSIVEPKMKARIKNLDKEPRNPEYKKNGEYMARTIAHFNVEGPCKVIAADGKTKQTIIGPYHRIQVLSPDLGSMDYVKEYLYSIGWEPLDWNWERRGKEFIKKSPKLCEESLRACGKDGELINRFYTTRSRLGILQGWIANTAEDGRLRGDMFTIATPTGRARHKIVVNVPSPKAAWGKEMRSLFGCEEGYKVVGADSSGNQFRALCHYIKDKDFTNEVINGDVHQKNADILGCDRVTAKPWIYAFLFGAGLEKLGLILTGKRDKKAGKESRDKFAKAIPGFKRLTDRLMEIVKISEARDMRASIPALDGRRIYLDSGHKALNYLLQSAEGITCKAAVAYTMEKFEEECIDARPLIFYHDEMQWAVKEEHVDRASKIMAESFREAPKWFNVTCMDGEAMVGNNWYETH
jgi:DNA polymerase III epsilon subunit-like protein